MCAMTEQGSARDWLRHQLILVEHWREELAREPQIDLDWLEAVEHHYAWLNAACERLDEAPAAR